MATTTFIWCQSTLRRRGITRKRGGGRHLPRRPPAPSSRRRAVMWGCCAARRCVASGPQARRRCPTGVGLLSRMKNLGASGRRSRLRCCCWGRLDNWSVIWQICIANFSRFTRRVSHIVFGLYTLGLFTILCSFILTRFENNNTACKLLLFWKTWRRRWWSKENIPINSRRQPRALKSGCGRNAPNPHCADREIQLWASLRQPLDQRSLWLYWGRDVIRWDESPHSQNFGTRDRAPGHPLLKLSTLQQFCIRLDALVKKSKLWVWIIQEKFGHLWANLFI